MELLRKRREVCIASHFFERKESTIHQKRPTGPEHAAGKIEQDQPRTESYQRLRLKLNDINLQVTLGTVLSK